MSVIKSILQNLHLRRYTPPPAPLPPSPKPRPSPYSFDDVVPLDPAMDPFVAWQTNPEYVAQARRILNDPWTRRMIMFLKLNGPAARMMKPGSTNDDRIVHQARIEGSNLAIYQFESLGNPMDDTVMPEPDYAPENALEEPVTPPTPPPSV